MKRLLALLLLAGCGAETDITPMPVADAGFDEAVQVGAKVRLDGSASYSPDGGSLDYFWRLVLRPEQSAAELERPFESSPSLTTDRPGSYLVTLVVQSGERESLPDLVAIRASQPDNPAPLAQASCRVGSSCRVLHGKSEVLDGRGSYDPEGDSLTYAWSQITSAAGCSSSCPSLAACDPYPTLLNLTNASLALAGFAAPDLEDVQLVFRLDVHDGSSTSSACVRYTSYNTPPIIASESATPSQVDEGASFTLSSSSGDSDSDPLTYLWEQCEPAPAPCLPLAGGTPSAVLGAPTSSSTTVTAPSVSADSTLRFRLTISDGVDAVSCTGAGCSGSTLLTVQVRDVF